MTKSKYQLLPPENPEYIGSPDTTFAGSRNGLSAIVLWDYLARYSLDRQIQKAITLEELAQYTQEKLVELGDELHEDLRVKRSPLSLAVRFKAAPDDIVFKYSLSGESLFEDGEARDYSHVYMMEHVTKDIIDSLVRDLKFAKLFAADRRATVHQSW